MEGIGYIIFGIYGLHIISLILILAILIKAISSLRRQTQWNPLVFEIIGFLMFAPTLYLLFMPDMGGTSASKLILYALIAIYFLVIFLAENLASTLLGIISLILIYVEYIFNYGIENRLLSSLNHSFIQTANKLTAVGNNSWLYYALWITAGLFFLAAVLIAITKNEGRKTLKICGLAGIILVILGVGRDAIALNQLTQTGKSQMVTEVRKFVFLRGNDLYLSDTSGKATPEKLTNMEKSAAVLKAQISKDEKYVAYTVTGAGTDKAEFELDLMDLQTKQPQKIFHSDNADRLGGLIGFSSEGLLAYEISPLYLDRVEQKGYYANGTPINPDPNTLDNVRVIDFTGKELNKVVDFGNSLWVGRDLVFVKPRPTSDLPSSMVVWGMSQFTDIYLSTNGKSQPQKIGEIGQSQFNSDARLFAKEPSELVWSMGSKNNPGNLGFAPVDYFSFDINTRKTSQLNFPDRTSHLFSKDMKYYILRSVRPDSMFIKSVDGSVTTDISSVQSFRSFWIGHQLLLGTDEGLKVADIDGSITKLTDQQGDFLIENSSYY